jgi:hypoxia up-regulated 1
MRLILCGALFLSAFCIADALLAAMSVDLGSQFVKIGLVKPGVPMEIVLNKDSRRKTPNIIAVRNGERFFGDAALQMSVKQPANSYSFFTDLIGKTIDNSIVQRYQQQFPHIKLSADELRGTVHVETENGTFSIESLLAMVLWNAREQTEAYAGQPVRDVVITVPVFFNQAERKAVAAAAEIAGLNLLQLMTDGSAAALNYGVFRRKDIKEQAQTLLIYDIGATKTTASIVEYRLVKEKNSKEQNPSLTVLGVGFDRTLGGHDITLILRDHLVEEFKKQHKTKEEINGNPRAMAKMWKEAERVKQVLSANTEHYAQIESAFEDRDFRVKITREQLQEMTKSLETRFMQPVVDALRMAEMNVDTLDQVVLMGAGTRVPRLQQLLQDYVKGKELARFLNTDEAVALGAVYQAAHLSKGFKVKKFHVNELQIYPVQVTFTSLSEDNGAKVEKEVTRVIYGYKSTYPAPKKVISFTSHTEDFKFNLNYGALTHLSQEQLEQFGSLNISEVWIKGVKDGLSAEMTSKESVFKGVKAHFKVNNYGIISVDRAELIVEKKGDEQNSTLTNIVNKIGKFFGSSDKEDEKDKVSDDEESPETPADESKTESDTKAAANTTKEAETPTNQTTAEDSTTKKESEQKEEKPSEEKRSEESAKKDKTEEKPKEELPPKPKVVKAALKVQAEAALPELSTQDIKSASNKLAEFENKEKAKAEREAALNALEAAVYDVSSKLEEEPFSRFGTEEELTAARELTQKLRNWLEDDVTLETTTTEIKAKKKELDASVKKLRHRKRQKEERSKHSDKLFKALNDSQTYLGLFKNVSTFFTETELSTLEKVVNETQEWFESKTAIQVSLADNVDPAYTVTELQEKTTSVEREVKYLMTKMYTAKLKAEQEAKKQAEKEEKAAKEAEKEKKANKTSEGAKDEKSEDKEETTPSEDGKAKEEKTTVEKPATESANEEDKSKESAPTEKKSHDESEL